MPLPLELIVRVIGVVSVRPPPVPVTVTVTVPVAAVALAVSVRVELPAPVILVGLKPAVTPEGNPLAERAIALSNPPDTVLVIVLLPVLPWTTVSVVGLAESVKPGATPLVMVKLINVVSVSPPPVPVTVMVAVPTVAELLAVNVKVEEPAPPEMLDGLKLAVTPLGSPLAERTTELLNPPTAVLVITEVPELPSCTLNEEGLAEREKLGLLPPVIVRFTAVEFFRLPLVPRMPIR